MENLFNASYLWNLWEHLRQTLGLTSQLALVIVGVMAISSLILKVTATKPGQIHTKRMAQLHFLGPVFTWITGFIMILFILRVDWTTLAAIAAAASLGITISIGELLQNLVGGIANVADDVFREGENLEINGEVGIVIEKGMLNTRLLTPDGVKIIVPNWKLLVEPVKNFTRQPGFRLRVRVPIDAFDFDSNRVLDVLNRVASQPKWCAFGNQGFVQFEEIGPSANIFYAYAWIEHRFDAIPKTGEFLKELTDALTAAGIGYGETSFIASRFVNLVQSNGARDPLQSTMPVAEHRAAHLNHFKVADYN